MIKKTILLLTIFSMAGCVSNDGGLPFLSSNDPAPETMFQQGTFAQYSESMGTPSQTGLQLHSHYIVEQLANTMRSADRAGVIAITNFADASSDYETVDELGFALGELMMRDLHESGFRTVDFKVGDAVRVTKAGDFALSRDFMELKNQVSADYVLVGTLIPQGTGVLINARIVDFQAKTILATGQSFVPQKTVNSISAYNAALRM